MSAEKFCARMEKAVHDNNFSAFNASYLEFLSQFSAFREAHAAGPTSVGSNNAIFGETGFYLNETTDTQAQSMLKNGHAASDVMSSLPLRERLEFLSILQRKIEDHAQDIMLVITADTGKPIDLSDGEMKKGNEWFDYAFKDAERQLAPRTAQQQTVSTDPLGVAQIIGAYNYPYALAVGGIVGSLATGNSVVVSAPLKAPNWVFPFMQAAQEAVEEYKNVCIQDEKPWASEFAAIAPHLIQYSVGKNPILTTQADVVHFVGGDQTGEFIRKIRGNKKTILEMGGSNVVTVMASATEKDGVADSIAKTIYEGFGPATGQRCTAPRMLCIQDGAEDVVQSLAELCAKGPGDSLGNPFTKGIKMGPLVDSGAHQKMQDAIKLAEELGAKVYGQLKVNNNIVPQALNKDSFWVNPVAIDWRAVDLTSADTKQKLYQCLTHEIFGPMIHIIHQVHDLDGAIAMANSLDSHGLAGAIFTNDPNDAKRYQSKVKATSLTVNGAPKDRSPWGPHGHPGLDTIGGEGHFRLYGRTRTLAGLSLTPTVN